MTLAELISMRWGLISGAGVLGFAVLLTGFWRLGRAQRRLERRCIELSGDLRGLRDGIAGNGAAVTALGGHVERLARQLAVDERHLAAAHAPYSRGVELAVRSARQGATEADLVADFGMSRQEAAFLRRMHGAGNLAGARRAVS